MRVIKYFPGRDIVQFSVPFIHEYDVLLEFPGESIRTFLESVPDNWKEDKKFERYTHLTDVKNTDICIHLKRKNKYDVCLDLIIGNMKSKRTLKVEVFDDFRRKMLEIRR